MRPSATFAAQMRRLGRLGWMLAALATLLALGVGAAVGGARLLARHLGRTTGLEWTIARLGLATDPMGVALRDVQVGLPGGGTIARARRVIVEGVGTQPSGGVGVTAATAVDLEAGETAWPSLRVAPLDVRPVGDGAVRADGSVYAGERRIDVAGLVATPAEHRITVDTLTVRGGALRAPPWAGPAADWTLEVARLRLREMTAGPLGVHRLDMRDVATVPSPAPFVLEASVGDEGRVRARGTIVPSTAALTARVKLDGVPLPTLLAPLAGRVRVVAGRLGGSGTIAGPPFVAADARLRATDVRVDDVEHDATLVTWRDLSVAFPHADLASLRARVRRLRLAGATLMVQRGPEGLLPFDLGLADLASASAVEWLAALRERTPAGGGESPPASREPRPVLRASVTDTRVEIRDDDATPPVLLAIEGIGGGGRLDPDGRGRAHVDGVVADARLSLDTRLTDDAVELDGRLAGLSVSTLQGWAALAGYRVVGGRLNVAASFRWASAGIEVPLRLVAHDLALETTLDLASADDPLVDLLGLPAKRALPLAANESGAIDVELTLTGRPDAPAFGLREPAETGLLDALRDAITGPLFASASVTREHDAEVMQLAAIPLPPGAPPARSTPAAGEEPSADEKPPPPPPEALERLAVLLRQFPELAAVVQGRRAADEPAELADRRAGAAIDYLQGAGVAPERLRAAAAEAPGPPALLVELGTLVIQSSRGSTDGGARSPGAEPPAPPAAPPAP